MAKDVIVRIWCDQHMSQDRRVEGFEQSPITLNGRTVTVDLCDACVEEFISPLAHLLEEYGVVPERQTAQARRGPLRGEPKGAKCIWCSLDFAATTSSGFMRHIKVVHGYANAQDAFGTNCAICGQGQLFMMMAHVKRQHPEYGFTHTAQVIDWAKHNGDPHGVYERTLHRQPSLDPVQAREAVRAKERAKPSAAA